MSELLTREQIKKKYCYENLDEAAYAAVKKEIWELERQMLALRQRKEALEQATMKQFDVELENGTKGIVTVGLHWNGEFFEFRKITKSGEVSKNVTNVYYDKIKLGERL
jgi:hypothetical protein